MDLEQTIIDRINSIIRELELIKTLIKQDRGTASPKRYEEIKRVVWDEPKLAMAAFYAASVIPYVNKFLILPTERRMVYLIEV